MASRRSIIAAVGGLTALSGGIAALGERSMFARDDSTGASPPGTPTVGLALSSSGAGCLDDVSSEHSGWIHTTPSEVTFDVPVRHDSESAIDAEMTRSGANEFKIAVSRTPDDETDVVSEKNCQRATRLKGAAAIPDDHHTVSLTVFDEEIATIERTGSFGEMRTLSNPLSP